MGRPPKTLNPDDGPTVRFALELRELREQAGNLPYWKMARLCGVSRSALSKAAGGEQIPSERVLDGFVRACRGDLNTWRVRRLQALREAEAALQAEASAARPGTALVPLNPTATAVADPAPGPDGA
ncbi:helix-turn-helix transcriptional regulator, partial [Spirillospora sp. NPDC049652]